MFQGELARTKAELSAAEEDKDKLGRTVDAYQRALAAEVEAIAAEQAPIARMERAENTATV